MNLGAEPKKVAALGVLVVVGGYLIYSNVFTSPETPSNRQTKSAGRGRFQPSPRFRKRQPRAARAVDAVAKPATFGRPTARPGRKIVPIPTPSTPRCAWICWPRCSRWMRRPESAICSSSRPQPRSPLPATPSPRPSFRKSPQPWRWLRRDRRLFREAGSPADQSQVLRLHRVAARRHEAGVLHRRRRDPDRHRRRAGEAALPRGANRRKLGSSGRHAVQQYADADPA